MLVSGCVSENCLDYETKQEDVIVNKNEDIPANKNREWLIGKTIKSVDSIIPVKKSDNFIIFIFNFYDCGDCVNAGFYISKKMDALYGKQIVYPIAPRISNPYDYQQKNENRQRQLQKLNQKINIINVKN
jgi:hypothetical protein